MDEDIPIATALGFPKPEYTAVERERRWLCREVPRHFDLQTEAISDLYVTGSRLRLREARPLGGGEPGLRLSRKADINSRTRLITSIYLPEEEFAVLVGVLPGVRIKKLRHRFRLSPNVAMSVDEFQGKLQGLIMAEAEFTTSDSMAAFSATELCRWIEQTIGHFDRFFLCGLSLSGLAATFAALQHPTTFCGVLSQSPSAWWDDERLTHSLTPDKRCGSRVWISVGDQECQENVMHTPVGLFQKASQRESVRRLAERLEDLCRELHYKEFSGGHDMACWAEELPRALPWLMR